MSTSIKELREEIADLRSQLEQAEQVLSAIRNGEVDALVISGVEGEQVFTLQTAERPYRLLIEAMNEGAVTLNADGLILFCNQCFATMLDLVPEKIVGSDLSQFIAPSDQPLFEALLKKGRSRSSKGEVALIKSDGYLTPAQLSLSAMPLDELQGVSIVVTDLTEPKRHAEMIASANLANSILDQAAEAMVVCDEYGRIIHASRRAHQLCGCNPMLGSFDETFNLILPTAGKSEGKSPFGENLTFAAIREKRELQGVEAIYSRGDGATFDLLLSAGAVSDGKGATLGWVINLTNINELKQAEHEREELLAREQSARRQAEQSSRLKDEFLATVSHELRTPLNAMLGWSRLLRVGKLDEAAAAHAVETIERNARLQNQLIEDLLDVSRIITGNLRLDIRPLDPGEFIDAAIDAVRPAAEAKEIEVERKLAPGSWSLAGDPARLQQVVWNLLSNAIKFTRRGGRVTVTANRVDDYLEIVVNDSGAGISPDFLPFVFDRFRQADGTTTRRYGGLGLGLAIVRQLVELHGGLVQVASPGELGGASLTIKLPLATVPEVPATHIGNDAGQSDGHPVPPVARELSGLSVLVIDDEADTLELIKVSLAQFGAKVTTARSAREGLQVLETVKPAIIISDVGMPDEDGYEFIRQLRARTPENGGRIPAVALTAYARAEDSQRALAAGFQRHVPKPVEMADLVNILANVVG